MTTFVQLHFLTPYAPSNLNRDDLGRPKTAMFGGSPRLRVSSQSLKRAWRTSQVFQAALDGFLGKRTRDLGSYVEAKLKSRGASARDAERQGDRFAGLFSVPKGRKESDGNASEEGRSDADSSEQLAFLSAGELRAIDDVIERLSRGEEIDNEEVRGIVASAAGTSDIALFGRMLTNLSKEKAKKLKKDVPHQGVVADVPRAKFSMEAACQVAHAISIHKVAIEDDYFTAMEELNTSEDRRGAAMVGAQEFASAVLYHYVCIDRGLLVENLGGNEELAQKTLRALGEACLRVAPNGKQNSFASRSRAHFALVEKGKTQPRSLASAFLKPVTGDDLLAAGVTALESIRQKLGRVYAEETPTVAFDVGAGIGSEKEVLNFLCSPDAVGAKA